MSDEETRAWIYIGALSFELTEGDVICFCSQYGEVSEISLPRDNETGKSRGFCFLKYEDPRSCELAVDNLNGSTIVGRKIKVSYANNLNALKARKATKVAPQVGILDDNRNQESPSGTTSLLPSGTRLLPIEDIPHRSSQLRPSNTQESRGRSPSHSLYPSSSKHPDDGPRRSRSDRSRNRRSGGSSRSRSRSSSRGRHRRSIEKRIPSPKRRSDRHDRREVDHRRHRRPSSSGSSGRSSSSSSSSSDSSSSDSTRSARHRHRHHSSRDRHKKHRKKHHSSRKHHKKHHSSKKHHKRRRS